LEVPEDPFSFGTGTSPILAKGLVIVQRDYEPTQSHLLALDAKTGETRWQTARAGYPTSYGTPMVWRHDDKAELIVTGSLRVCGYDLDKGQETWNAAGMCAFVCTSAVASSNNLFVASWSTGSYGEPFPEFKVLASGDSDKDGKLTSAEFGRTIPGDFFVSFDQNSDGFLTKDEWDYVRDYASRGKNALMAIRPGGSGDITDTHVEWKVEKGIPYVPSPLYYQGQVYVVKDGGLVSSVDAETGKPHYHRKRLGAGGDYYASPIAAGGRVYLASLNGEIVVIEAGPELKILASNDFEERLSATPAIVGDTLYLRTAKHLYALR
jgi:outer membrane protein assembly factor BamB